MPLRSTSSPHFSSRHFVCPQFRRTATSLARRPFAKMRNRFAFISNPQRSLRQCNIFLWSAGAGPARQFFVLPSLCLRTEGSHVPSKKNCSLGYNTQLPADRSHICPHWRSGILANGHGPTPSNRFAAPNSLMEYGRGSEVMSHGFSLNLDMAFLNLNYFNFGVLLGNTINQ